MPPAELSRTTPETPPLNGWESVAAAREQKEVVQYQHLLSENMDLATRSLLEQILETEIPPCTGARGQMDAGIMLGLKDKRALVTGGSRGVGRATALLLGRLGAHVGIGYHSRTDEADQVVAELREGGVKAWAQAADLTAAEGAEVLFRRCGQEFEGLDVFVANAGIWSPEAVPIHEMSDVQWSRTQSTNVDSVFWTLRQAARMLSDGGSIVLVSSTAGQRG